MTSPLMMGVKEWDFPEYPIHDYRICLGQLLKRVKQNPEIDVRVHVPRSPEDCIFQLGLSYEMLPMPVIQL